MPYGRCACRITALPALPLLPHLRYLYVQDNAIASLAPPHGAPALQLLNLSFNALGGAARVLRALSPAAGALAELDLAGNPLEAEPECAPRDVMQGGICMLQSRNFGTLQSHLACNQVQKEQEASRSSICLASRTAKHTPSHTLHMQVEQGHAVRHMT